VIDAGKAAQVPDALEALLETVPGATVERNSVLPEKIPDGGLIILRDGDPGEPEQALGGFGAHTRGPLHKPLVLKSGSTSTRSHAGRWRPTAHTQVRSWL
jgi:hypothetical protein